MEVVRLDDILLPCGLLPPGVVFGAMKMDVEGFEPQVLKGGEKFLAQAKIPYVVFEIGRMKESERKSVLRFFYSLGYTVEGGHLPEDLPATEDVVLVLPSEGK
jgi:hypothetical protein